VIRERHGFVKLSTAIPHADSQLVPAAELRELVHPDELGLADFLNLPETCLLISQLAALACAGAAAAGLATFVSCGD
jgi:hypothetical protein